MTKLLALIRNSFQLIGDAGSETMCFGWFHEIEIPKELKEKK